MSSHEDNWNLNVLLDQFGLKVEPAQSGQPDVKDQATRDIRKSALQHFGRRSKHLDLQAYRLKQIGQRPAHRDIVVDNNDDRLVEAGWLLR
jgi:hypothetical protein